MARIRSTHPEQWTDEDFVCLSYPARLLKIALLRECDGYGVFEWKPIRFKMRYFPADNIEIDSLLRELVEFNQCLQFEKDGRPFGRIIDFNRLISRPPIPKEISDTVYARDGKQCVYCNKTIGPFHLDHVHPWSRGGQHSIENLVVACAACNLSKQDKSLEEWQSNVQD